MIFKQSRLLTLIDLHAFFHELW